MLRFGTALEYHGSAQVLGALFGIVELVAAVAMARFGWGVRTTAVPYVMACAAAGLVASAILAVVIPCSCNVPETVKTGSAVLNLVQLQRF